MLYYWELCTVSVYIKYFSSKVEIDNEKCHRCSMWKTTNELVYDKLIMSLDGLHTFQFT